MGSVFITLLAGVYDVTQDVGTVTVPALISAAGTRLPCTNT